MEQSSDKIEVVREKLYTNIFVEFIGVPIIPTFNSDLQKISLYQHETMGKVLLLDDVIQFATQDEYILHETLAYWPYCSRKSGKGMDVLIVGGGDLGVASRILSLQSVKNVTVVDIDPEVTRISCRYTPEVSQHAEDDSRLKIIHENAETFIKTFSDSSFDVVVADTTDEIGVGESLYSANFLKEIKCVLKDEGIVMRLAGSFFLQKPHIDKILKNMSDIFGEGSTGLIGLPLNMYQGGLYTIAVAVKNGIYSTDSKRSLGIKTRWYSSDVHNSISRIIPGRI